MRVATMERIKNREGMIQLNVIQGCDDTRSSREFESACRRRLLIPALQHLS